MAHAARFEENDHHEVLHGFAQTEPAIHGNVLSSPQHIILPEHHNIDHHEEVEETLSIADKEKELIVKALKKHKGKRKDAALDLGISERTLYRKLKEYNIGD
jgi:transcriptional regulator of acetoin/glycerol metabolism